tara:strand:+ start:79 stop:516 length:438 start_codon:yes stop_codon:yes gene_type:complete
MFIQNWFQQKDKKTKIGFEDVLYALQNPDKHILINTLSKDNQHCLIKNTLSIENEEKIINEYMNKQLFNNIKIIIYGENSSDSNVDTKYKQINDLGFEVYIYGGGMFEWLLLQDIYSNSEFPTTTKILDILKYKPKSILHIQRIT